MANNTIPDWAPRRPMVVMDRNKMSAFWRAAAIRGAVTNSAGALSGLGDGNVVAADAMANINYDVSTIADRTTTADGSVLLKQSDQSVDSLLTRLSDAVMGAAARLPGVSASVNPATQKVTIPWWQVGLLGVGAFFAGRWVWKKVK